MEDITFSDPDLRAVCEDQRLATKRLGAANARKLRSRLADLQAVANVGELVAGNPHPLRGDRLGQFSVSLAGGTRLVFEPTNEPTPRKEDRSIDWSRVTNVRVVFIGDYHD